MKARLNGAVIAAAAITLALGLVSRWAPPRADTRADTAMTESARASQADAPVLGVQAVRARQPQSRASQGDAARPHASLSGRVERLARSGAPRDAFAAFELLDRCVRAREFDAHFKSLPMERGLETLRATYGDGRRWLREACGDVSMAQISGRIELAERSARAGVPGAASAWIEQGPFGDKSALEQRPDDPLVADWVRQAIEWVKSGATHDDIDSIVQLGMLSLNWELTDIERVKLLVDSATQQDMKTQLQRLARRDTARGEARTP